MTLFRQLFLAVIAALSLLYLGSFLLSVSNEKSLIENQMQTHAQDAATSLALSMTQVARENDQATMEAILAAVSDSGYYQRIYVLAMEGKKIMERNFPVSVEGVPSWFVSAISLPQYEGRAELSSGWVRLGELIVVSHPGEAYRTLWRVVVQQLIWFSVMGVVISIAALYALRHLLAPLLDLESQANAICEQRFTQIKDLPKTRELKTVALAMNRLSEKLEGVFTSQSQLIRELRHQAQTDDLTGLSNRTDFDARLNTYANDDSGTHSGLLMIVALNNLSLVNEMAGRAEGNGVLKNLGEILVRGVEAYEEALVARRQGQEFAVFVPDLAEDDAKALAASLEADTAQISWQQQDSNPLSVTAGFTYASEIENGPELLSEADMALHAVDLAGGQRWKSFAELEQDSAAPVINQSLVDWRQYVDQVIEDKSIELHVQETVALPDRQIVAYEIFTRFRATDNHQLTAGTVIPLVQRFGRAEIFDKLVLQMLAETAPKGSQAVAINICPQSVSSPAFRDWLEEFLSANPQLAQRLVIEVSEHTLKRNEVGVKAFERALANHGAGLAIDHFGVESSSFGYLGSVPLRYLKVHRSFIKNIHFSQDSQFYLRVLSQLAKTREIQIVAEGVEAEEERQTLADMNIEIAQGYLFGRPRPLVDAG